VLDDVGDTMRNGERELIAIPLRYFSIVADLVGKREERITVPAGLDLGGLVAMIAKRHPSFADYARGLDSEPGGPLRLILNGQLVMDWSRPLADGDEVSLFPVISGG
jgi:molybdopterin converting factor small subunit